MSITWSTGLSTRGEVLLEVRVTRAAHLVPGARAGPTRGVTRQTRALGVRIQPGLTPTALTTQTSALTRKTPVLGAI